MSTVAENLEKLIIIKENIRTAISDKGVTIPDTTPFTEYPSKINEISGGATDKVFDKLITGTLTEVRSATPIKNGKYLFANQKNLTLVDIVMSKDLVDEQYQGMFQDCTSLTEGPILPATQMNYNCYNSMFSGCSSLTKAPELPATTGATGCYDRMFEYCTSLTETPNLPMIKLDTNYYSFMFADCLNLQKTGKIYAEGNLVLATNYMFSNCKNLKEMTWTATTPPRIPDTIWEGCPQDMIIYVPDASVDLYTEAEVWSKRATYIRPISTRPTE